MNRVTKRTWIMGLFLLVLLGGMMFFLWEYVTQAGEWVTFPGSPHVYNNANIGCGTVTDRSGNVLLDITEERTYSSDAATPRSTGWATGRATSAPPPSPTTREKWRALTWSAAYTTAAARGAR